MNHTIIIKRSLATQDREQGELLLLAQNSSKILGSYFSQQSIATGLTPEEIQILLPLVVGNPPSDPDFYKKVQEYYRDIATPVPFTGLDLEIGLTVDNNQPIGWSEKKGNPLNMPINVPQYLIYRHALKHPHIAASLEEAEVNPTKTFYMYDAKLEEEKQLAVIRERQTADGYFYALNNDEQRIKEMLLLCGIEYWNLTATQRQIKLKSIADEKPGKFIAAYSDELGKIKCFIRELVRFDVIETVGERYLLKESKIEIGSSLREACLYLNDEANSDTRRFLEAQLKELSK